MLVTMPSNAKNLISLSYMEYIKISQRVKEFIMEKGELSIKYELNGGPPELYRITIPSNVIYMEARKEDVDGQLVDAL